MYVALSAVWQDVSEDNGPPDKRQRAASHWCVGDCGIQCSQISTGLMVKHLRTNIDEASMLILHICRRLIGHTTCKDTKTI